MTIFRYRLGFRTSVPIQFRVAIWLFLAAAILGFGLSGYAEATAQAALLPVPGKDVPVAFHGKKIVYVSSQTAWQYSVGLRLFFIGWLAGACTLAVAGMAGHLELKERA